MPHFSSSLYTFCYILLIQCPTTRCLLILPMNTLVLTVDISAQLMLIECVKKCKTRNPCNTNETKNKQSKLNLSNDPANYILLLRAILEKHNRAEYRATAKKPFSFNYLLKHTRMLIHLLDCSTTSQLVRASSAERQALIRDLGPSALIGTLKRPKPWTTQKSRIPFRFANRSKPYLTTWVKNIQAVGVAPV